jgi:hypothetical protein
VVTNIVRLSKSPGTRTFRPLAQPDVVLVGEDLVAGVGEAVELALDSGDHLGMTVAGVHHGDAGGEVDVAAALHVPDMGVLGALDVDLGLHPHAAGDGGLAALGDPALVRPWSSGWRSGRPA